MCKDFPRLKAGKIFDCMRMEIWTHIVRKETTFRLVLFVDVWGTQDMQLAESNIDAIDK